MKKIMISDCDHKDFIPEQKVFLKANMDFGIAQCKTREDVIEKCKGAVVLLNQYAPLDAKVFQALPNLKFVVRYGVGFDNINIADATAFGVQICNVPDYGVNEVADHALALLLTLTRKIMQMSLQVRSGGWDYTEAIPIRRASTQTIGIVGVGRIGTAFAHRVHAMGYTVIGCDIEYGFIGRRFPEFIEFLKLDELLRRSDIISIHCSLNEQTKDLFDDETFAKMKQGSYLINVSRGGMVDENALYRALGNGHLAGAGIDVAKQEPMPLDHPLRSCEKILITPHIAWYSEDSAWELKEKCAQECVLFMNGDALRYPVNRITRE